jgi:hypothetical protein
MGNHMQGSVMSLSSRVKLFNILQVVENHENMTTVAATHTHHELTEKINILNAMDH